VIVPILAEEPCLYPDHLLEPVDEWSSEAWRDDGSDRHWWLVYTKARQEKALARYLLARQIPFYLPLVPKANLVRGRRVESHLPLFAGYLFLYGDGEQRGEMLTSNRVSQTHRVEDSFGLRRDLRQVNGLIQAGAPLTLEQRLMPGQSVRVRSGPFKGTSGTLISRRGDTKLLVAVDFIGQGVSIEIDDFQLEAA
jgi:transcriptional antiterminator RfaH